MWELEVEAVVCWGDSPLLLRVQEEALLLKCWYNTGQLMKCQWVISIESPFIPVGSIMGNWNKMGVTYRPLQWRAHGKSVQYIIFYIVITGTLDLGIY